MVIKLYGDIEKEAVVKSRDLILSLGHELENRHFQVDLGVAPLLREKVPREEIEQLKHGLLVFHPSLLPHRRGPSAIKHAYLAGDPVTGATWFWANDKLDAGDICEMEVVRVDYYKTFQQFYKEDIIPALLRTLERSILAIDREFIRRIPQVERYASYDPKI